MSHYTRRGRRGGFTLVEIMIVVVIIGLLAAIAIPMWSSVRERTLVTGFINDLRIFRDAIEVYVLENGSYPSDGSTGTLPPELEESINAAAFTNGTPVGGEWDIEYNDSGVTCAVGVHIRPFSDETLALLIRVDESIDDGNPATGHFRRLSNDRYYWIIEP